MKYLARVNGKAYEVDVERAPSAYKPIPRGIYTGELQAAPAPVAAPVAAPAPVAAAPAPAPAAVPAPAAAPAPKKAPAAAAAGDTSVNCPMPGTILQVKVSEGQAVKAGDTLFVLEAMKMENEIVAPCDGTVKSISVNKGDAVQSNDQLAIVG